MECLVGTIVVKLLGIFLCVRIIQRIYFMLFVPNQVHIMDWKYSPRKEMEKWIESVHIQSAKKVINSSKDGVQIHYRLLGKGKRLIYLANGVGTDLFMWFPCLKSMYELDTSIFDKCTFVVSNYRGLFAKSDTEHFQHVEITINNCIGDILDIMRDMGIECFDGLIGWSTGAQVGYNLSIQHPNQVNSLFLLGPSAGNTLQYILQPYKPLPVTIRPYVARAMIGLIDFLKSILHTKVYDYLKLFNDSYSFHLCLIALAFFGGFPPIQPVYFHEYMRDQFQSRYQIRALFDLILSLNAPPLSSGAISPAVAAKSVLISGYPDFLTGSYLSDEIASGLPGCRQVRFTMGSHFVLLEWPHIIGKELALFLNNGSQRVC